MALIIPRILCAAIFDIDGTLLDSNDAHAKAWKAALDAEGLGFKYEQVRELIGMGTDNLLPAIAGIEKNSERGKRVAERKKKVFAQEYLPQLKPFPKAKELVEELHRRGVRIAIASSSDASELDQFIDLLDIRSFIEATISSSDAKSSKPDPDVVSATIARLQLSGCEAVMVGDTPYDIEAALKAGITTIAFRCGGWSDEGLRQALAIYDDPSDLLEQLDESPFMLGRKGELEAA